MKNKKLALELISLEDIFTNSNLTFPDFSKIERNSDHFDLIQEKCHKAQKEILEQGRNMPSNEEWHTEVNPYKPIKF